MKRITFSLTADEALALLRQGREVIGGEQSFALVDALAAEFKRLYEVEVSAVLLATEAKEGVIHEVAANTVLSLARMLVDIEPRLERGLRMLKRATDEEWGELYNHFRSLLDKHQALLGATETE